MEENKTIDPTVPRALSVLLREHCGLTGETAKEFMEGMKKLTLEDRADFKRWFEEIGIAVK